MRFAAFVQQARLGPRPWLSLAAAAAFLAVAALPPDSGMVAVCGSIGLVGLPRFFELGMQVLSPGRLALDWGLMAAAMMLPLVALPVDHVRRSVLASLRPVALAAFLASYLACWLAAGLVLVPLGMALSALLPAPVALAAWLLWALVWSATPVVQAARNRGHQARRIAALGRRVPRDCAAYGARVGFNCLQVCWPGMVVPLLAGAAHLPAMVAVCAYLFADRIAPPAKVAWRLPPALETILGSSATRQPGPLRAS